MVFSSIIFLWIFLPLVFVINLFMAGRLSNIFLLLASLLFYTWGEPQLVVLMMVSILVNWLAGKLIGKYDTYKKWILVGAVAVDLSLLGYYKYAGFLVEAVNALAGRALIPVPDIRLPIGISFFTFQAISYVVDVYRGETQAQDRLVNTALYISFFPQLIAGPIVRYHDINLQLENRRITWEKVAVGFRRFVYGLSKKVLISNVMGACTDQIYALEMGNITGAMAWLAAACYMFQIYYDFSGYSDMAIGLGKMFGFDFTENFNYPYISHSVREFWRRWHISLSSWFRDYLYIPLGGSRCSKLRYYGNLMITFLVSGLWHGASWNFVVWGGLHGVYQVIGDRLEPVKRQMEKRFSVNRDCFSYKLGQVLVTFALVNFSWVFFRAVSLKEAVSILGRIATKWNPWVLSDQSLYRLGLDVTEVHILAISLLTLFIVDWVKYKTGKTIDLVLREQVLWFRWLALFALLFGIIIYGMYGPAYSAAAFIYFQF